MTGSEVKQKDVGNRCDGRRRGKPSERVRKETEGVEEVVGTAPGGILNFLKQDKEGCMVPWNRILRIGDDVILVELHEDATAACE